MSILHFHCVSWRHLGLLLPLLLAACASGSQRAVHYPPAPGSHFTVRVRPGDTLSELAYRYQVKEDDLLALNTIYDRHALKAGEAIRVPGYGHFRGPETRSAARARPRPGTGNRLARGAIERSTLPPPGADRFASTVPVPQSRPGPQSPPAPQRRPLPPGQYSPQPAQQSSWFDWLSPAQNRPPAAPAGTAATAARDRFLWPVSGPVIASFGQSAGGGRNDGINIQTPRGAPVRASAAGTVTYVGNELKGYGNLILIRHDNGYVTAYAHSDAVVVQRGERVTRGQVIGYAGMTGDVDEPQLHFELRNGTRPVDPRPFMTS